MSSAGPPEPLDMTEGFIRLALCAKQMDKSCAQRRARYNFMPQSIFKVAFIYHLGYSTFRTEVVSRSEAEATKTNYTLT